jgi:hypothetical protein
MVHSKVLMFHKQEFLKRRLLVVYKYMKIKCPDVLFLYDLRKMVYKIFNSSKHGDFSNLDTQKFIAYVVKNTPDMEKPYVFHLIRETFTRLV